MIWFRSECLVSKCRLKVYPFGTLTLYLQVRHMMLPLFWTVHHFCIYFFCSCNFRLFVLLFQPWILFGNWMISHEMHSFNNNYVTDQQCSVLQALSLKFLNNKTRKTGNSYAQDHSAQTQRNELTNSLIRNSKVRASSDNWNVSSAVNLNRKTWMQITAQKFSKTI
jgi:hypothetical protein